jgi:AAA domain
MSDRVSEMDVGAPVRGQHESSVGLADVSSAASDRVSAPHGWMPSSLVARAANPPEPPTIGGLLYPGKRTLLSGETESLKTWAALILAKAEMDLGYPVAWVDLDAMGSGAMLARLRALGVPDAVVDELFLYYEPSERVTDRLEEVCGEVAARGIRLFVVDAFNPMLNLHGLDPGSTPDIETFWREIATPITDAGAAPTMLDHVVKNADARGKYAYGSERKASGAIVHVGFRLLEPFARGATGRTLLATHKDRPGYLPRPTIGRLVLVSDGEAITYALEEVHSHDRDSFRPTVLMERISRKLQREIEPVSQRWIEENVKGQGAALRTALDVLVSDGYLSRDKGPNGYEIASLRPYRELDEEPQRASEEGASPVRLGASLTLTSTHATGCSSSSFSRGTSTQDEVDSDLERVHGCVPDVAECPKHDGSRHWRARTGRIICWECLPPVDDYAVAEWLDAASVSTNGEGLMS